MADHSAAGVETKHGHGDHPPGHEAHAHHGDYLAHVKPYLVVGALLLVFTVITVGLSYVHFDKIGVTKTIFGWFGIQGHAINIIIGLMVATFKVCLVGLWFMHLKQEKSPIWRPLIFTFIFVTGLFLLCLLHYLDPIPTTSHWHH